MEAKKYLDLKYKKMNKYLIKIIIITIIITQSISVNANENKIAILVNDTVITNYDIQQRLMIFAIINEVQITSENSGIITNKIVDELIDGALKNEKISEYDITVSNRNIDRYEKGILENRGLEKDYIFEIMSLNNINTDQFYKMIITDIGWQILISRLYYRGASVSDIEIEELIKNDPSLSKESAEQIIIDKQLALKSSKMLRDLRSEATIEYKQ